MFNQLKKKINAKKEKDELINIKLCVFNSWDNDGRLATLTHIRYKDNIYALQRLGFGVRDMSDVYDEDGVYEVSWERKQ